MRKSLTDWQHLKKSEKKILFLFDNIFKKRYNINRSKKEVEGGALFELTELLNKDSNIKRLINAGFHRSYLWRLKHLHRRPTLNTLIKIEHALKIPHALREESRLWQEYPNRLYYYLQIKKVNMDRLAKLTQIKHITIKKTVLGLILPSKNTIWKICRALWLKPKEVFPYWHDQRKSRGIA